MIAHIPRRRIALQHAALEVSAGLAAIGQRGVADEAEASVIGGIAEHDAAFRAQRRKPVQTPADQCAADALALQLRCDGDRAEAVPAPGDPIDLHRREGGMADDASVVGHSQQRDRQRAGLAQRLDDAGLGAAGVRRVGESGGRDLADRSHVVRMFVPDLHARR